MNSSYVVAIGLCALVGCAAQDRKKEAELFNEYRLVESRFTRAAAETTYAGNERTIVLAAPARDTNASALGISCSYDANVLAGAVVSVRDSRGQMYFGAFAAESSLVNFPPNYVRNTCAVIAKQTKK